MHAIFDDNIYLVTYVIISSFPIRSTRLSHCITALLRNPEKYVFDINRAIPDYHLKFLRQNDKKNPGYGVKLNTSQIALNFKKKYFQNGCRVSSHWRINDIMWSIQLLV